MSSIPTKQIDGDVSIGRNVSIGGDANIQGDARIGHDLVVEGWLEAKNIRGANKGLFASVEALREAYPQPHNGWFAGVPVSDQEITDLGLTVAEGKTLFRMYVGSGGNWVPINKLYEITVDNRQVEEVRAELSTLRGQHESLEKRVDTHDTEISSIKTEQTALGNRINANTDNINALKERVDEHESKLVPDGGSAGDVLMKLSDTDGDVGWRSVEQIVALPDWRGFTAATTSEELAKVGDLIVTTGKSYVTVCVDPTDGLTARRDNGCAPTQIRIVESSVVGRGTDLYLSMDYNGKSYSCKITKSGGAIVGGTATYSTEGTEMHTSTDGVEMITKEI